MVYDPLNMKKHRDKFLESLTPEEMEIHKDPKNQEAFNKAANTMGEVKKKMGEKNEKD